MLCGGLSNLSLWAELESRHLTGKACDSIQGHTRRGLGSLQGSSAHFQIRRLVAFPFFFGADGQPFRLLADDVS